MIVVVGQFRLPSENLEKARAAMVRVVEATRAEPGCQAYSYAEDVLDPGLIRVSELWDNREALTSHFEAAHMQVWQLERAGFGLSGREMNAYSTSVEEVL